MVYYMFHKPSGCISARKDVEKKTVLDYFRADDSAQAAVERIFPVGRLDKDTEGLLILTDDGKFCDKLMHPKHHVEKTYLFWTIGAADDRQIKELEKGVLLTGELEMTKPAKIEIIHSGDYEEYASQMDKNWLSKVKVKPHGQKVMCGYITISEGRKHQVKRMLKYAHCYVVYLKRISIGSLRLDEKLAPGEYRELTREEIELLTGGLE